MIPTEIHTIKGHVAYTGNWVYYYLPDGQKIRRIKEKAAFAIVEKMKLTALYHTDKKLYYTNNYDDIARFHAEKFDFAVQFARSQKVLRQVGKIVDPYKYELEVIDSMIKELHNLRVCFASIRRDVGLYSLTKTNPTPLAELQANPKRTKYRPARRARKSILKNNSL